MERNHEHMFSANLKHLFLSLMLMLMMMVMVHGISHGYPMDQAGRLNALLDYSNNPSQGLEVDDHYLNLVSNGLSGDDDASYDQVGKMEDDLIQGGLPGQPSGSNFKQYAGYVNVDETTGRSLFYYFVEASLNSSSKPLVLWLNGGPGCSSLGLGAMVEIGPFGVNPDGITLYTRKQTWTEGGPVANVLFLDSPAGVGFSYSNTTTDYNFSGDNRTGYEDWDFGNGRFVDSYAAPAILPYTQLHYDTPILFSPAQDAYTFLLNWFRRYPQYKDRDFYMAGESYAGFYIPELTDIIINGNKEPNPTSMIQLKGIMIGNGILNLDTDRRGRYDYAWSHALISDESHQELIEHCLSSNGPKCNEIRARIGDEIGDIDMFNIYAPKCLTSSQTSKQPKCHGGFDPCELNYVHTYLNLPQVQKALHANRTKLPYTWQACSVVLTVWEDRPSTMFPIYRRLIASGGLRILLYSGDMDAVVPVSSTRYSIAALNLTVVNPWRPWLDEVGQVAGYKVVYDGLTFATVRGGGHQATQSEPQRALALFKYFLAGTLVL